MARSAVISEVSGAVWKVLATVGDTVEEYQELMLIESMKMEIPVLAPRAGRLVELLVAEGDAVAAEQIVAWID